MLWAGPEGEGMKDERWEDPENVRLAGSEDAGTGYAGLQDVLVAGPSVMRREGAGMEIVYCVDVVTEEYDTSLLKARAECSMEARQSRSLVVDNGGSSPKIRRGLGSELPGALTLPA